MAQTSLAQVLTGPRRLEVQRFPIPETGPDDGLIRVEGTGICGSDWHPFLSGPRRGNATILGHEIVGTIEQIGEHAAQAMGLQTGDRVVLEEPIPCGHCIHCRTGRYQKCTYNDDPNYKRYGSTPISVWPSLYGGYSEYVYLDPNAVAYKIPDDMPVDIAPLFIPVSNGLRWVGIDGECAAGDTVVIQGPGQHGLGCVIGARENGAEKIIVTGLAHDAARFDVAQTLGATHVITADQEDVVERVSEITGGTMADVIVDTSSRASAPAALALDLAKVGGRVVLAGGGRNEPVEDFYIGKIVTKELTIRGVYGREIATVLPALRLMESGKYPLELLSTHTYPLKDAERAVLTVGNEGDEGAIHVTIVNE